MSYREPADNNEDAKVDPGKLKPWYIRWTTRPFSKLNVLSDEDPCCVEDAWGRKWYQNRSQLWVSTDKPYTVVAPITHYFMAALVAYQASIGKKIFIKGS
jgi:hypothetical protein